MIVLEGYRFYSIDVMQYKVVLFKAIFSFLGSDNDIMIEPTLYASNPYHHPSCNIKKPVKGVFITLPFKGIPILKADLWLFEKGHPHVAKCHCAMHCAKVGTRVGRSSG